MGLVENFIARAGPEWEIAQNHPFVRNIESGKLDVESFKFYLVEDYHYLIAYCRAVAALAYRAPDLEILREMSGLLHSTLFTEMELHREYAAKGGIDMEYMERKEAAPVTLAYSSYMQDIAMREDFLGNLICLLPCAAGYAEIGARIKSNQNLAHSLPPNPYQDWIDVYSCQEFQAYAGRMRYIANEIGHALPSRRLEILFDTFLTSTRYEWMFFEMSLERNDKTLP